MQEIVSTNKVLIIKSNSVHKMLFVTYVDLKQLSYSTIGLSVSLQFIPLHFNRILMLIDNIQCHLQSQV